ncbi:MAG: S8 family serine peptidase [Planctomycetota bacterium]
MSERIRLAGLVLGIVVGVGSASAGNDSVGPDGINAFVPGLDGTGVVIGMVEPRRPGKPGFDDPSLVHTAVDLAAVFKILGPATANQDIEDSLGFDHANRVAGILISNTFAAIGVAPGASLHARASGDDAFDGLEAIQELAIPRALNAPVVNLSIATTDPGSVLDGSSPTTLFLDWSANEHNTLYTVAGPSPTGGITDPPVFPSDNFNGITVGASEQSIGVGAWDRFSTTENDVVNFDAIGPKTSIDILAPGVSVRSTTKNNGTGLRSGTSFATPHVTGASALLIELAESQIGTQPTDTWNDNALRHQVLKTVLMNSADKVAGTPQSPRIGMQRTIRRSDGGTWLTGPAANDPTVPLDIELGAGHLNVGRAVTQFAAGEVELDANDTAVVGSVGWDYAFNPGPDIGTFEPGITKYVLDHEVPAGGTVSATLAWDREIRLDDDFDADGEFDYDPGLFGSVDTFVEPFFSTDTFNDLNLYLMPAGATDLTQAVASSTSFEMNLEHFFFEAPSAGMFEIWVAQFDNIVGGPLGTGEQDYAIAWWADKSAPIGGGDLDGNGMIDQQDYNAWASAYGSVVSPGTGGDANGDGLINAADYTLWRDAFALAQAAATQSASVTPEPTTVVLVLAAVALSASANRRHA